jgi:hypothetical protein
LAAGEPSGCPAAAAAAAEARLGVAGSSPLLLFLQWWWIVLFCGDGMGWQRMKGRGGREGKGTATAAAFMNGRKGSFYLGRSVMGVSLWKCHRRIVLAMIHLLKCCVVDAKLKPYNFRLHCRTSVTVGQ